MAHPQHNFTSNFNGSDGHNAELTLNINGVEKKYTPAGNDQTYNVPGVARIDINLDGADLVQAIQTALDGAAQPVLVERSIYDEEYVYQYIGDIDGQWYFGTCTTNKIVTITVDKEDGAVNDEQIPVANGVVIVESDSLNVYSRLRTALALGQLPVLSYVGANPVYAQYEKTADNGDLIFVGALASASDTYVQYNIYTVASANTVTVTTRAASAGGGGTPDDENGFFNSSLYQAPGDGVTESLTLNDFRIKQGTSIHGSNIEFVPTHQEGGIDFGEVYLNPGTYILSIRYTLQWVGNPRGTFLPLVCNVGGQPFDFSYEQENTLITSQIRVVTARQKVSVAFPFDADTPPMGIWAETLSIAQLASNTHPAVIHDTTLAGSGTAGSPLGVTTDAFGKVKDIPTSVSQFRTGDVIPVDGPNGPAKMGKDDLLTETAQNALADNVAPAFDPTRDGDHKYLVNEFVVYAGKLYRFDTEHYGAWNSAHVHLASVAEILNYIENDCLIFKDFFSSAPGAKYIKTDVGVGNVVDFTPLSAGGYKYVILPCKKGDVFKIFGQGGSEPRLWCFVDSSDKVVSVAAASSTEKDAFILAPTDGKLIYNTFAIDGCYVKAVFTAQEFFADVRKNCIVDDNVISDAIENYYIPTNLNVGATVDYTPVYGSGFRYLVRACKLGDFIKIRGQGGSEPRLWCFVDSTNKVVSVAAANSTTSADGMELVAPCDGKIIFNSLSAISIGGPFFKEKISVKNYVDGNYEAVSKNVVFLNNNCRVYKEIFGEFTKVKYIKTDVGVGNVVDFTPLSEGAFAYIIEDCAKGEIFKINGQGGSEPRLWCFVDSSDKVVSVAAPNYNTPSDGAEIVAPVDGKLIVNMNVLYAYRSFKIPYPVQNYIDEQNKVFDERINVFEKYDIPNDPTPFSQLGSLLENLNLSLDTRMEQIYSLFDELVADYPSLITKYDAANLVDLEYPRYANGISAGDPDYLETPAYKTYIYKISNINEAAGNLTAFPKKKLLIVGAVHGEEYFASVNCYSLAAHFLKNVSSDLFSILSLFDVWIMPCTNGYGIIHPQRTNANGVDINRNFGTSDWTQGGSQEQGTWSGTSPDSEFEVQLIEGLKDYINPDFYVDHHCTPGHSKAQFYSESPSNKILARSYDSLVQISDFFIKNYPAYFGTSYHLFMDFVYTEQLPYGITKLQGCSDLWYYENGTESATIEIMGFINYTDGAYDAIGHRGDDLWMVNEYTLRNQLAKYLPIVLT